MHPAGEGRLAVNDDFDRPSKVDHLRVQPDHEAGDVFRAHGDGIVAVVHRLDRCPTMLDLPMHQMPRLETVGVAHLQLVILQAALGRLDQTQPAVMRGPGSSSTA